MTRYEDLPYRPCVGVMLFSKKGLVFIGRRTEGPEHIDNKHAWQMPQGGVDKDEDPWPAALRELYEETNVTSVEKIAESRSWYAYDIPPEIASNAWKGKFRGQTQKWYALRFTGKDSEIDVLRPAGGHKPEFAEWRWEKLERLPKLVVPFKRKVYEQVIDEFAELAKPKARTKSMRRRR